MRSGHGRSAASVICLAACVAGCGDATPALPTSCVQAAGAFETALSAAPGPVKLTDGTPISTCVARARGTAQLEQVGTFLAGAADRLAARAANDRRAAVALGYLVGAARRGAALTNGVASELQRRIETAAALRGAPPAALAALHLGIVAGQRSG